jgi:hypothetical protein
MPMVEKEKPQVWGKINMPMVENEKPQVSRKNKGYNQNAKSSRFLQKIKMFFSYTKILNSHV